MTEKEERGKMNIAIIGSGYVGLVAAACLAEIGHRVVCVDNDERKIASLKQGVSVIHEEFLPELLARHVDDRLRFTTDLAAAVRASSVVFLAGVYLFRRMEGRFSDII